MARFHGKVGYANSVEDPANSGIWKDVITEQGYFGDVTRISRQLDNGEQLNDHIRVGNAISIVADQYAIEHFLDIRYVEWEGQRWTVTDVEVQRPRLLLRIGSVYNGPTPDPTP